jgi:hypothetical protein
VNAAIHDSLCGDRGTLKRVTLHRKKLAPMRPNFNAALRGACQPAQHS